MTLNLEQILALEKVTQIEQLTAIVVDLQNCYFTDDTTMDFTMAKIGFEMDNAPTVAANHAPYIKRILKTLKPSQIAMTVMEENRVTWGRHFTTPDPHPAPLGKGRIDPIGLFGTPSGELLLPAGMEKELVDAGVLIIDKYGIGPGDHNPKYIRFLGVNHTVTHAIITGGLTSRCVARMVEDLKAKGITPIILEDLVTMPKKHPRPDIDLATERDAQIAKWRDDKKVIYCQSADFLDFLERKFKRAPLAQPTDKNEPH